MAAADTLTETFADILDEDTDGRPAAALVVSPTTLEEAGSVLRFASEHRLACLLWGAGQHQGQGYEVQPDVIITSRRLNKVLELEPEDLTVVVQGGVTVGDLKKALAERGVMAVLPEEASAATVGGIVAVAASSWRRARYGPVRDRVLQVELVTGDGRVVTAGGRVVKNVTGYDIPRLATGSHGGLGLIGTVCLKLWPRPLFTATLTVADAETALAEAYRPLAVVETRSGSAVYLGGSEPDVHAQARKLGGHLSPGLEWPEPIATPFRFVVRVPATATTAAIGEVRRLGFDEFQAAHGVGEVRVGASAPRIELLKDLRSWAEGLGGAVVSTGERLDEFDPWGTPPPGLDLHRRVVAAFDPVGVCNPGRLPACGQHRDEHGADAGRHRAQRSRPAAGVLVR